MYLERFVRVWVYMYSLFALEPCLRLDQGPLETGRVEREPRTQRMADLANEKPRLHLIQPTT